MTDSTLLEQAADPLDEVVDTLAEVVTRLRAAAGSTPSPAALNDRASTVRAAVHTLMRLPLHLFEDASTCDARAAALRAADEASAALADAEAAAGDAQDAYDATADPEQAAARKAITARQLHEEARDALTQAEEDGAEPAALAELHGRARDTRAVAEHEASKLASAQQARQAAREALDRARAGCRKAQDAFSAAEEAAGHPTAASLSLMELYEALMFSFPFVLFGEEKPTPEQLAMCRYHATAICDDFGWTPAGAEQRIRQQIAQEMIATARQGRAVEISDGKGTVRLVTNPLGMMGGSQAATVAMSR
jgi:hypothetical protein